MFTATVHAGPPALGSNPANRVIFPGKGAAIGATSLGLTGGIRSRRAVKTAEGSSSAAVAAYQQQFQGWTRNYMAAMEAKGYTVR